MSFSTVPVRENGKEVFASWWNDLRTAGLAVEASSMPGAHNFILNSLMRFWQTNIDISIVRSAGAVNTYGADQILTRNQLTAPSTVRIQRVAGVNTRYAYQKTVTASSSTGGNYDTFFIVGNPETQLLLNKTITFTCKIKAVGNVDRVGMQFLYNTSEAFSTVNTLGSNTNTVINNSTFTQCTITFALAAKPTLDGILEVRIRPNRASSGNENDVGNGIIIEQPMLVIGSAAPSSFFPAYRDEMVELAALQRYYEKSYAIDVAIGSASASTNNGHFQPTNSNATNTNCTGNVYFRTRKRAVPTISVYASNNGAQNQTSEGGNNDPPAGGALIDTVNQTQYAFDFNTAVGRSRAAWHWVADARIF